MRYAFLSTHADETAAISRYLPNNYQVAWHGVANGRHAYVISGEDVAGWTLDGYVIPRLASGMRYANEIGADTVAEITGTDAVIIVTATDGVADA